MNRFLRKWHRRIAVIISLPLIVVIMSGIVLQFRSVFNWIQPKTISRTHIESAPIISLQDALALGRLDSGPIH